MADFDKLRSIAEKGLKDDMSGHDYSHVMRVFKFAVLISQTESEADIDVVKAATLMHSIAYSEGFFEGDYSERSAKLAQRYLEPQEFTKKKIGKILYSIRHHNIWVKNEADDPIEVKILRDAERLESLGHTGIVKAIVYAAFTKKSYVETLKNSLKLKSEFETYKGKELSKPRVRVLSDFVKKLEAEY